MWLFLAIFLQDSVSSLNAINDHKTIIVLGGARKVLATITEKEESYEIEVRLIPVRCFDPFLNRQLSQDKGHAFVVEALMRHLGNGKIQSVKISNSKIIESKNVDDRYVFVESIPRKGISFDKIVPANKKPNAGSQVSLLKAYDDYQQTLAEIIKALTNDMPKLTENLKDFYLALVNLEQLGIDRFTSLRKEVKTDRWLLGFERDELLDKVKREENQFLIKLRKLVEEAEKNV